MTLTETSERVSKSRSISLLESLAEPRDLTRQLVALFGARAVGRIAGYQDPKISYRWSRENGPKPAREALRRLYAASRVCAEVRAARTANHAAAWFNAPHPLLGEVTPLELLVEGRFAEVSSATAIQNASPFEVLRQAAAAGADTVSVPATTVLWHEASLRPMLDVVRALALRFGAPAVAAFAGDPNTKAGYRWVKNEGKLPSGEAARRLYVVYRVVIALDAIVSVPVSRAWFFAANQSLDERSPLDVAADGDLEELTIAADQLLIALNKVRSNR